MRRLLLASLFAVACRPTADRPSAPPPVHRVVSLAPSSTELLFALGAGHQVVGRTTWCRYPPAALQVPDVGDGLNPNIEAIAARQPDLVVLYRSPMNETAAAQLRRLGIASVTLPQDRLEDIASAARELGRRTGREAAGDSIAGAIEALLGKAPPAAIARLVFVVWDNPPMVIGAGSYLDQLATLAAGSNVFHDLGAASATVSIETIAARNPDVILVLSDSTALPSYSRRPEWRAIRAVREGRFIMLPADLFGRPSPTAPNAVAVLHRALEGLARR